MHLLIAIVIIILLVFIAARVTKKENLARYRHGINDPIVGIFYDERPMSY